MTSTSIVKVSQSDVKCSQSNKAVKTKVKALLKDHVLKCGDLCENCVCTQVLIFVFVRVGVTVLMCHVSN